MLNLRLLEFPVIFLNVGKSTQSLDKNQRMPHIDVWSYHESAYLLIDDNVKTKKLWKKDYLKTAICPYFNKYRYSILGNSVFIPTSFRRTKHMQYVNYTFCCLFRENTQSFELKII